MGGKFQRAGSMNGKYGIIFIISSSFILIQDVLFQKLKSVPISPSCDHKRGAQVRNPKMWRSATLSRKLISLRTSRQSERAAGMNKVPEMFYFAQSLLAQTPRFWSLGRVNGTKVIVRMEVFWVSSFSWAFPVSPSHPPKRKAQISCG